MTAIVHNMGFSFPWIPDSLSTDLLAHSAGSDPVCQFVEDRAFPTVIFSYTFLVGRGDRLNEGALRGSGLKVAECDVQVVARHEAVTVCDVQVVAGEGDEFFDIVVFFDRVRGCFVRIVALRLRSGQRFCASRNDDSASEFL